MRRALGNNFNQTGGGCNELKKNRLYNQNNVFYSNTTLLDTKL